MTIKDDYNLKKMVSIAFYKSYESNEFYEFYEVGDMEVLFMESISISFEIWLMPSSHLIFRH